jgi:hypothetical protein
MKHEELLHYAWQYQVYTQDNLRTEDGLSLCIFKTGMPHVHAGPDFMNARMLIDGIHWAGQVEVHIYASDWYRHRHHLDPNYDNVILHVVWENDKPVFRQDGTLLPTLSLKTRIPSNLSTTYYRLKSSHRDIPCEAQAKTASRTARIAMLDRALSQRLQRKAEEINRMYRETGNDPDETAYRLLLKNFGFHLNNENFYRLSLSLPFRLIGRYREQPFQMESILFGMAGLLESPVDSYARDLSVEFRHFLNKHSIAEPALKRSDWKFLRTRPRNFPTLRLAQLSALLSTAFDTMTETVLCYSWETSAYWQHHYDFGKEARLSSIDKTAVRNHLRINVQVPLLMAFKELRQDYAERAMEILGQCPVEQNAIVRKWSKFTLPLENAGDSQALIEQYTQLCTPRSCLRCPIGIELLTTPSLLRGRNPSFSLPPKEKDRRKTGHSQSGSPG